MNEGTPYTVALALRIRVRMAELDINQTELARRAGVSKAWLCHVVHGRTEPSCSMAVRLADALTMTLDELLRGGGKESE